MSTDRVFTEGDAIWWDANVRGPRKYSFKEMDEDYKGLSPFSTPGTTPDTPDAKHVYVIDPDAAHPISVDVNWLNIIALVIVMVAVVAVVAIFAAAAVFIAVGAGILLGVLALAFSR